MTAVTTVEVPAEDLLLEAVFSSLPETRIELEPAVALDSTVVPYVWVTGGTVESIRRGFRNAAEIRSFGVIETTTERTLVRVEWNEPLGEFFDLVTAADGVVLGAVGEAGTWSVRLRFERHGHLSGFFRECVRRGLSLDVRRVTTPGHAPDADADVLTESQREAIRLAVEAGYFAVPRAVTLQDLADELGISDTAASQRLRRGLASMLSAGLPDLEATRQVSDRPADGDRESTRRQG